MVAQPRQRFSFESYLLLERNSPVKHEFLGGEVWAMAGGSAEHAAITMNVGALLHAAVRDQPCRVYSSDLRVTVESTGLTTYPDVTVICGVPKMASEDRNQQTATNPTVLVEVLSPSTEDYDRGEKLAHYKRIASLREILLVSQAERLVVVWRRGADGEWAQEECRGSGVARLGSLSCDVPLDEVYRNPVPA
jgi:Uma2 family endonuclease